MATINMRILKTVLFLVVAVTIIQGHPLSTSVVQDDKTSSSTLAEFLLNKTEQSSVSSSSGSEEKNPDSQKTDSLKTDSLNPDLLKTNLQKKQKSADPEEINSLKEPERQEEPKPANSAEAKPESSASDLKPKPGDQNKPSSSSSSSSSGSAPEPQVPCSSTTSCSSAPKPGNHVDQRQYDYDQRQNGTENYRIQVDGLVLVLAPVEALLLAGGMGSDLNGQFNFSSALDQPLPKGDEDQSSNIFSKPEFEKPSFPKSAKPTFYTPQKPADGPVSIKLINLIAPLLEQRRH